MTHQSAATKIILASINESSLGQFLHVTLEKYCARSIRIIGLSLAVFLCPNFFGNSAWAEDHCNPTAENWDYFVGLAGGVTDDIFVRIRAVCESDHAGFMMAKKALERDLGRDKSAEDLSKSEAERNSNVANNDGLSQVSEVELKEARNILFDLNGTYLENKSFGWQCSTDSRVNGSDTSARIVVSCDPPSQNFNIQKYFEFDLREVTIRDGGRKYIFVECHSNKKCISYTKLTAHLNDDRPTEEYKSTNRKELLRKAE